MKKLLISIIALSLFAGCSKDEGSMDNRSDEQIALELLFTDGLARYVKRANSYQCENSELARKGSDIDDIVYTIQFDNDGTYLLSILYSNPVIINGRFTYIGKEGNDYRFENTYEYQNPNSSTPRHPIIGEGTYLIYFDDLPRSNAGYFKMISDECVNSVKEGFEFAFR